MSNTDLLNKTWTLSDSEENLSEEIFSDHSPTHQINNNLTQVVDPSSPEFLLKNLNRAQSKNLADQSIRSSYTSFNLSPRSTTFVKDDQHYIPGNDFRSLNIDWQRYSIDIENIFEKICNMDFISLFDENTSGLEFDNGEPIIMTQKKSPRKYTLNVNNLTVNLDEKSFNEKKADTGLNTTNILNKTVDKPSLNVTETLNKTVDIKAQKTIPVPKSFDMFVDDLKQSTSEVITIDSPNELNLGGNNAFNLIDPSVKMMTSSVDKDLHTVGNSKEAFRNRLQNRTIVKQHSLNLNSTNLITNKNLTSSNFDLDEIQETSSPFRPLPPKNALNHSYTIDTKKSLDFNEIKNKNNQQYKPNNNHNIPKRNRFDSNESLNDNDETSSKSSSSNHDQIETNFQYQNFGDDLEAQYLANATVEMGNATVDMLPEDDLPRTVFNQTYTSWATSDEQLQMDAYRQQKVIEGANKNQANLTQEIVKPADNLNRTMDIIDDDDLIDDDEQKGNLNRTREIDEPLNRTREIIDDEIDEIPAPIDIKPVKSSTKRLSLISSSGYVRPNIENPIEPTQIIEKPVIQPTSSSKLPSPKRTLVKQAPVSNQNFEFKKPAIPKLTSPPKSSRLPTSSVLSTKTITSTIPKQSTSKSIGTTKPKTLSVNNSTSNILKPSTGLPTASSKILTTQNSVSRIQTRNSMIATTRLVPSAESKENNGHRMSLYANKIPSVSKSTASTGLKPPSLVTKSLKVSPNSAVSKNTGVSKLQMPNKISYQTSDKSESVKSMIPSFKTSALPVSKIATMSKLKK